MPKTKKQDPITADIAAALGPRERTPVMLWYVSPRMAADVPVSFLESLGSAPKVMVEILRTPRGALLVVINAAALDQEGLTDLIEAAAEAVNLRLSVLVQGTERA